jgi:phosphatidate cytidylyltransferase
LRDIRILSDPAWHLFGRNMVFLLFSVLWAQDTAAWFVGHWIGKHRMASVVSPKKTWEGAVGGILAAVLAAWIVRESAIRVLPRMEVLAIGLGIGIMGQVSDLLESLIKRCLGMKDSSSLLPGHGGILDRFDGFIFTVPFLYYYLVITGRGGL